MKKSYTGNDSPPRFRGSGRRNFHGSLNTRGMARRKFFISTPFLPRRASARTRKGGETSSRFPKHICHERLGQGGGRGEPRGASLVPLVAACYSRRRYHRRDERLGPPSPLLRTPTRPPALASRLMHWPSAPPPAPRLSAARLTHQLHHSSPADWTLGSSTLHSIQPTRRPGDVTEYLTSARLAPVASCSAPRSKLTD